MTHKFNPKNHKKLNSPVRRRYLPPEDLLCKFGLSPGDSVADIGAGTGYFAIPAAEIVGSEGAVFAVDISPEMLDMLKKAAAEKGLTNIKPIQSGEYDFKIQPESVDYVLMVHVLHEVDDKVALIEAAKTVLKPGGKLIVIEWIKEDADTGPPPGHRIDSSDTENILNASGIADITTYNLEKYFYIVTGKKAPE